MDTERLEQAINRAVATTATPDDSRLAAILAQLEKAPVNRPAPRPSVWPWLLLAAAGAAAAGGGYWYAQKAEAPIPAAETARSSADTGAPEPMPASLPAAPEAAGENGGQQRNTNIIYRQ